MLNIRGLGGGVSYLGGTDHLGLEVVPLSFLWGICSWVGLVLVGLGFRV